MELRVPVLSYDELRASANSILNRHNAKSTVPVPIESIVEFAYSTTIIPFHELQKVYAIDAFVSRDLKTIYVDNGVMESRSPNRYRFSLAHELGHIVLHREVFANIAFNSVREWKQQIQSMKETDRRWLEWQAHCFAGLMLVPKNPLVDRLNEALEVTRESDIDIRKYPDIAKDYICNWIGKHFEVSSQVVEKRLDKDGLWPPP